MPHAPANWNLPLPSDTPVPGVTQTNLRSGIVRAGVAHIGGSFDDDDLEFQIVRALAIIVSRALVASLLRHGQGGAGRRHEHRQAPHKHPPSERAFERHRASLDERGTRDVSIFSRLEHLSRHSLFMEVSRFFR